MLCSLLPNPSFGGLFLMENLSSKVFGRLTVVSFSHLGNKRNSFWTCKCVCGVVKIVSREGLVSGQTKSCGCLQREIVTNRKPPTFKDMTGMVFGRLKVLSRAGDKGSKWVCKCVCGEERCILRANLLAGRQISCGCHNREMAKKTLTSHGLSDHPLYRVWSDMLTRCYNPKKDHYKDYGGRGIAVCDEWKNDFIRFYEDMKEGYINKLQIDRKDVNGNYSKANCRWVTPSENGRNRRNNRYFTIDGVTKLAIVWAEEYGIAYPEVYRRLARGLSEKEVIMGYKKRIRASG